MTHFRSIFMNLLFISSFVEGFSQGLAKEYTDSRGNKVLLPLGALSFADEIVRYDKGKPRAIALSTDSSKALGPPDYVDGIAGFATMGCGGILVMRFSDNALINVPGPDLYVFEVGKYTEATILSVSADGKKWTDVGRIEGGTATVDIGNVAKPGESFRYIMLTDLRSACENDNWPGADIDAVAAIGSARDFSLRSSVLFNLNDHQLKPQAKKSLDSVAAEINKLSVAEIQVQGHTDSTGSKEKNQPLSERRAESVKTYLATKLNKNIVIKSAGYADRYPVASNRNKEGQERNRRVNILVILTTKP